MTEADRPSAADSRLKLALRVVCAVAMTTVGILHFAKPTGFLRIMPPQLPAPLLLVYLSGVFEVLGGIGVLLAQPIRRIAALGLVCLYIAVFPANINMALHHIQLTEGGTMPVWAMWARLPLQAVFIAWAYWLRR